MQHWRGPTCLWGLRMVFGSQAGCSMGAGWDSSTETMAPAATAAGNAASRALAGALPWCACPSEVGCVALPSSFVVERLRHAPLAGLEAHLPPAGVAAASGTECTGTAHRRIEALSQHAGVVIISIHAWRAVGSHRARGAKRGPWMGGVGRGARQPGRSAAEIEAQAGCLGSRHPAGMLRRHSHLGRQTGQRRMECSLGHWWSRSDCWPYSQGTAGGWRMWRGQGCSTAQGSEHRHAAGTQQRCRRGPGSPHLAIGGAAHVAPCPGLAA